MYELHFRRWFDTKEDRSVCGRFDCLAEASDARKVSGDLVVYSGTNDVVLDPTWLWEWEKKDPTAYARKAIEWEKSVRFRD